MQSVWKRFLGGLNTFLSKKLSLDQIIQLLAIHPRTILGLEIPQITEGVTANLTIFNPNEKWTFTSKDIFSKSRNSPALSNPELAELQGKVLGVINKGQFWMR